MFLTMVFVLAGLPIQWMKATSKPLFYRDKVLVLIYHHINASESGVTISPERFASHLDALIQSGYHVISMERYLNFVEQGKPIPDNAVVITFDDGYESFYIYAYPELQKRHLSATNFIVVGSTDHANPRSLPHLTWDEIRKMKKHGMSFYSHTYNQHRIGKTSEHHKGKPLLTGPVSLDYDGRMETEHEYQQRIRQDLQLAEKRIEQELGPQTPLLAFPYGAYNETVIRIGEELGIRLFFTVDEGINDRNTKAVYRINAGIPSITADGLIKKLQTYNSNFVDPSMRAIKDGKTFRQRKHPRSMERDKTYISLKAFAETFENK